MPRLPAQRQECHTRWRYQTSISRFDAFMGRCLLLAEFTEERLKAFYAHTLKCCKKSTAKKYVKQLS